jgi:MFS transporter, DHA3 family, macrolide efflux protein
LILQLTAIMIVTFFGNMFTSPVDSLMPAYFLQSKYTESAYSTFMLGITSGGIIGGICLSKIQKKLSNNKLLALGFAFGALGMISLYYNISIIPYISTVLIGISYGVVSIMNAAILQLETPKDMVARTFSIFKCISYIAGPAGIVLAGYFGEIYEMRIVFVPFGLLLLVTSLLTIILIKPLIISENLN